MSATMPHADRLAIAPDKTTMDASEGPHHGRATPYGLILAGAVAKGPFHAGALSVLAERDLPIGTIVGSSAGALNAAVYAAGVVSGRPEEAASVLRKLWRDQASWRHIAAAPSLSDIFHRRGLLSNVRVRDIVDSAIRDVVGPLGKPKSPSSSRNTKIELRLVATYLEGQTKRKKEQGVAGRDDFEEPAMTTYESVFRFTAGDFTTTDGIARIANAAAASASFPGLFVPSLLLVPNQAEETGHFADGGTVNNAPISYVLEATEIDRVIVISTHPEVIPPPGTLSWPRAGFHLIDILVNERLFRDLRQAQRNNQRIDALLAAQLGTELTRTVLDALRWRPLEVTSIRPEAPLPGNAFTGLIRRSLRETYMQQGEARARDAIPAIRALAPFV